MVVIGVIMILTTVVVLAIVHEIGKIAVPLINALERLADNLEAFVDANRKKPAAIGPAEVIDLHPRTDHDGPDAAS